MGILSNWLLRASWHVSYGEHSRTMSPIRRDSPANLFLDSCATNIPTKPLVTHELVYSPPSGHLSIQSGQLLYPTPAPDCNVSAVHILLVPSNCKGPSVNLIQTFSSSVICQSQKDKRGVLREEELTCMFRTCSAPVWRTLFILDEDCCYARQPYGWWITVLLQNKLS